MSNRDDDDWDDRDDPQPADCDDDDDLPEMVCPACGRTVSEDTQKCPHCGDWITPRDPTSGGPRKLLYVALVLILVALIVRFFR